MRPVIVLTGGPGGGKTTLIEELRRSPQWAPRFITLPEAISLAGQLGVPPTERLFQRLMVAIQIGMEDAIISSLDGDDRRILLCHRGCLDPLAYWLARGWQEADFFAFVQHSRQELYRRYTAVIHLVTAADGAPYAYRRYPQAHRSEPPEDAVRLDGLLHEAWCHHPRYVRIDNQGRGWESKALAARRILEEWVE
jgi:predicted ATPase